MESRVALVGALQTGQVQDLGGNAGELWVLCFLVPSVGCIVIRYKVGRRAINEGVGIHEAEEGLIWS